MTAGLFLNLNKNAMQQKKKKQNNAIPLLELLAYNSTVSARNLLKKNNMPDAIGYGDLQDKLRELYAKSDDKVAIEKEFAEMHPHKEFILKYLAPAPVETKVILPEPKSSAEGITLDEQLKLIKSNNVLIASIAMVSIVGLVVYMSTSRK